MGGSSTRTTTDSGKTDDTPQDNGSGRTFGDEIAVRLRWMRSRLTGGMRSLSRSVDHGEVVREVESDGILSARFVFMTIMSCAIAMLGLLLSSPAVVIGAMLISPLMGPIMLMGFSLCVLDYSEMRRSLVTMAVGIVAALVISIAIVAVSPLREATPEILARTRPNLFDLMVAIFSGLAGGYSVIHRKGATIVGVAIATALMPPLAVVGFGIATGNMVIAGGAFFLFMTNLLAIALSVTGLAWLHGFATVQSQGTAKYQTILVIVVFAALSAPLGLALRDIAYEARVQNVVREQALTPFAGKEALVAGLTVSFPRNQPIQITQTVYTKERVPDAQAQLQDQYAKALGAPVSVRLNQVAVDQAKPIDEAKVEQLARSSIAPLQQMIAGMEDRQHSIESVRDSISFRTTAIEIDPEARTASIVAARTSTISLEGFREMEASLYTRFPDWTIRIVPAMEALPTIMFEKGGAEVSQTGLKKLDLVVWALQRWEIGKVEITGRASATTGGSNSANRALAQERADVVAAMLKARGVETLATGGFGGAEQIAAEREEGVALFQVAEIVPVLDAPPLAVRPAVVDAENSVTSGAVDEKAGAPVSNPGAAPTAKPPAQTPPAAPATE